MFLPIFSKMKTCTKCKATKPLSDFYVRAERASGYQSACKSCCVSSVKRRFLSKKEDVNFIQNLNERNRGYYHKHGKKKKPSPEYRKRMMENTYEKFPEKKRAWDASSAIKPRAKDGFQFHHWSYKPEHVLDVIEISKPDHYLLHRYIIYDQERMMYRRSDTNVLLDTKESHYNYFLSIKNNQ